MTKEETIKLMIQELSAKGKSSYEAYRSAGGLESFLLMDGFLKRGEPYKFLQKKNSPCSWDYFRKETYPEMILRLALEHYL